MFLADLTGRADWQSMAQRFRASHAASLRVFVNLDYLKGAPFKIGVASLIGTLIGFIAETIGHMTTPRVPSTPLT